MNPDVGSLAVGGGTKGFQRVWGWPCLHSSNSLVLENHCCATDHSFVSKIRIFVLKTLGFFTIELRYPKHVRAVSSPRNINAEKEGKTVKMAASPFPPLSSKLPGGQKLVPEQTGADPRWRAG